MCGGSMQEVVRFKSKDDVQYIVGTNVRKVCKEKNINLYIHLSHNYLQNILPFLILN